MRVYDGSQWIAASAASQAILTKYKYVATAGQTTFSGTDANSLTLAYTVGSIIVTLNGVVLNGADYTATSGTSVVLGVAASLNDELNILSFSTFDVANTYTQSQIDAFAVKLTGDQTVAGVKTFSGATTVMSGNVGIGTSSPSARTHVVSAAGTPQVKWSDATNGTGVLDTASGLSRIWTNVALGFGTGAESYTERARIDSSGNLLVGTTSFTSGGGGVSLKNGGTNRFSVTGTGAIQQLGFHNPNGEVGSIYTSGSSTVFATSSDYRLKENVQPMQNALVTISQLKPCTYTWKTDGSNSQGFIAHELQEVVPDCVIGEKDAVDEEGNPKYQGIDTSFLIATLTAAIQELKTIVDAQATRITALEQA